MSFIVFQSVSAATIYIYNDIKDNRPLEVSIESGSKIVTYTRVEAGKPFFFNSGIHAITAIKWRNIIQLYNPYRNEYVWNNYIFNNFSKMSGVMLGAKFFIRSNGAYSYDFNVFGRGSGISQGQPSEIK